LSEEKNQTPDLRGTERLQKRACWGKKKYIQQLPCEGINQSKPERATERKDGDQAFKKENTNCGSV